MADEGYASYFYAEKFGEYKEIPYLCKRKCLYYKVFCLWRILN